MQIHENAGRLLSSYTESEDLLLQLGEVFDYSMVPDSAFSQPANSMTPALLRKNLGILITQTSEDEEADESVEVLECVASAYCCHCIRHLPTSTRHPRKVAEKNASIAPSSSMNVSEEAVELVQAAIDAAENLIVAGADASNLKDLESVVAVAVRAFKSIGQLRNTIMTIPVPLSMIASTSLSFLLCVYKDQLGLWYFTNPSMIWFEQGDVKHGMDAMILRS
ncbi:hypothetical protein EMCG_01635 [[Emmonsia] crescens]|uniref:Uncharacterized protein n=1 Tax=[Emmonsia] crescens TaxID=73230 RepID=A0A0G2J9I7_9EURO|nr:hypothetical protein EMCG_01635 [Emmonsia crescens UAMH 3008]